MNMSVHNNGRSDAKIFNNDVQMAAANHVFEQKKANFELFGDMCFFQDCRYKDLIRFNGFIYSLHSTFDDLIMGVFNQPTLEKIKKGGMSNCELFVGEEIFVLVSNFLNNSVAADDIEYSFRVESGEQFEATKTDGRCFWRAHLQNLRAWKPALVKTHFGLDTEDPTAYPIPEYDIGGRRRPSQKSQEFCVGFTKFMTAAVSNSLDSTEVSDRLSTSFGYEKNLIDDCKRRTQLHLKLLEQQEPLIPEKEYSDTPGDLLFSGIRTIGDTEVVITVCDQRKEMFLLYNTKNKAYKRVSLKMYRITTCSALWTTDSSINKVDRLQRIISDHTHSYSCYARDIHFYALRSRVRGPDHFKTVMMKGLTENIVWALFNVYDFLEITQANILRVNPLEAIRTFFYGPSTDGKGAASGFYARPCRRPLSPPITAIVCNNTVVIDCAQRESSVVHSTVVTDSVVEVSSGTITLDLENLNNTSTPMLHNVCVLTSNEMALVEKLRQSNKSMFNLVRYLVISTAEIHSLLKRAKEVQYLSDEILLPEFLHTLCKDNAKLKASLSRTKFRYVYSMNIIYYKAIMINFSSILCIIKQNLINRLPCFKIYIL